MKKIVFVVDLLIDAVSRSVFLFSMLLLSPKIGSSKDSCSKVCNLAIMIFKVCNLLFTFQLVIVSSSDESVELRTVSGYFL